MNKLIKKIVEENLYLSWKNDVQDYTVSSASLEELEDLVKAVVRKCVDIADKETMDDTVGYAILKHFGVE